MITCLQQYLKIPCGEVSNITFVFHQNTSLTNVLNVFSSSQNISKANFLCYFKTNLIYIHVYLLAIFPNLFSSALAPPVDHCVSRHMCA